MNRFTRNENGGLFLYEISGLLKFLNAVLILFFYTAVFFYLFEYKGLPDFKRGPEAGFYAGIVGSVFFSYLHTKKVEVYFINKENHVERLLYVYGIKFIKTFRLNEVRLVSKTKQSRYGEYDDLYLVDKKGRKYFMGQSSDFDNEEVTIVAAEISRHCNIEYDHEF